MKKFLILIMGLMLSPNLMAYGEKQLAINFIKNLIPSGTSVLLEGVDAQNSICKLELNHREASGAKFDVGASASATLWIRVKGNPWPVKFNVAEYARFNELQYARVSGNVLEAQNINVPDDQFSSKERQTITLEYSDTAIVARIVNEQKGLFFGYRLTHQAQCSFTR